MGKKIPNPTPSQTPLFHLPSSNPSFPQNDHFLPSTNNDKKSHKQAPNGSNQTSDNPLIDEQRLNTHVNQFDLSLPPTGIQSNPPLSSSQNQIQDDKDNDSAPQSKKGSQYLTFFKYYYDKTKTEHPNWTPSQITMIVSLLWKKKKNIAKVPSKAASVTSRRSNKPLAPKDAFRMKHKNLSKEEIDELWSKLPKESKNFWKKEGNSYCTISTKSSDVSSVKQCKNQAPVYNSMRALLLNF